MLAIIGGSLFFENHLVEGARKKLIRTPHGKVVLLVKNGIVYLSRHGPKKLPPHMIPHKAHMAALKRFGVQEIISFNSVGSLKQKIKPGSLIIPDDYMNLYNILTFFDHTIKCTVPGFWQRIFNVFDKFFR